MGGIFDESSSGYGLTSLDHLLSPGLCEEDYQGRRKVTSSIEIADRGDFFVMWIDLPGFARREVDVLVRDHRLVIRGRSVQEELVRSFSIPEYIVHNDITGDYREGVLEVILPKKRIDTRRIL